MQKCPPRWGGGGLHQSSLCKNDRKRKREQQPTKVKKRIQQCNQKKKKENGYKVRKNIERQERTPPIKKFPYKTDVTLAFESQEERNRIKGG